MFKTVTGFIGNHKRLIGEIVVGGFATVSTAGLIREIKKNLDLKKKLDEASETIKTFQEVSKKAAETVVETVAAPIKKGKKSK